MVVNVDLAPTLAEIAEVVPPSPVDGRSVAALLNGSAASTRPDFQLEWWNADPRNTLPTYQGVRSEQFKYVTYPEASVEELYDLVGDPFELVNRAADPQYADALTAMRARLDEYLAAP
jgi:arylsulfatase A-like enzyme